MTAANPKIPVLLGGGVEAGGQPEDAFRAIYCPNGTGCGPSPLGIR